MGLILTAGSALLFGGSVVCLALGPLLFGFFYLLYGLLVVILGRR